MPGGMTREPGPSALSQPTSSRPTLSREERLAAKLRENLRRRKAQARAQGPDAAQTPPAADPEPGPPLTTDGITGSATVPAPLCKPLPPG